MPHQVCRASCGSCCTTAPSRGDSSRIGRTPEQVYTRTHIDDGLSVGLRDFCQYSVHVEQETRQIRGRGDSGSIEQDEERRLANATHDKHMGAVTKERDVDERETRRKRCNMQADYFSSAQLTWQGCPGRLTRDAPTIVWVECTRCG